MCPSDVSAHGPAERLLPDLLARAAHVVVRGFAEELRKRGTTLPAWRVLAALRARPGETVTGLAEACLLQQPTMTKLLDRMVRDGLVTREQDARDRRIMRIALTPEGEAKAAGLVAAAERYEAGVLARHPEAEGIKAVLRDLVARFGPAPRQGGGGEEGGRGKGDAQGEGDA